MASKRVCKATEKQESFWISADKYKNRKVVTGGIFFYQNNAVKAFIP